MEKGSRKIATLLLLIMCCVATCLSLVACNDVVGQTPTGNTKTFLTERIMKYY